MAARRRAARSRKQRGEPKGMSQEEPGAASGSHEEARGSREEPGRAKVNQEEVGGATKSQEAPYYSLPTTFYLLLLLLLVSPRVLRKSRCRLFLVYGRQRLALAKLGGLRG